MTGKANFPAAGSDGMAAPRLLADEMLGRLARYLRMLGCDTVYVRGWSDDEIVRVARADGRTLLTRDRLLASRLEAAVRIRSVDLPGQFREVAAALPALPRAVSFERCTLCNGELRPAAEVPAPGQTRERPPAIEPAGVPVFACIECGHRFWEGSHTAAVRRHVAEWIPGAAA
jgi:uncharacterized protein